MPQCYGTADDVKLGAFCVSEPDAGSDVSYIILVLALHLLNERMLLSRLHEPG